MATFPGPRRKPAPGSANTCEECGGCTYEGVQDTTRPYVMHGSCQPCDCDDVAAAALAASKLVCMCTYGRVCVKCTEEVNEPFAPFMGPVLEVTMGPTGEDARFRIEPDMEAMAPATPLRDKQVGGTHYLGRMQPFDVIDAFGLDFYEASALKYLLRWRKKGGVEDLEKCVHYIEVIIEKQRAAE